ncbi:MAG: c-type cytochrome [Terriglobia bacterium]
MPDTPTNVEEKDPVVTQSLSAPIVVFSLLLILSLVWSVYDEIYGLRPWKRFQHQFVEKYSLLLRKIKPRQAAAEKVVRASEEYRQLEGKLNQEDASIAPRRKEIDHAIELTDRRLTAITEPFALTRSEISALVYRLETTTSEGSRESLKRSIEQIKARTQKVTLPSLETGSQETVRMNFNELEGEFTRLQQRKTQLTVERTELTQRASEIKQELDAYMKDHLNGLTAAQVDGLIHKMETFTYDIKQIHVKSVDLVDRCESCHLGIREPVTITAKDMGGQGAFTSHPTKELLQIHDPEVFGCTPCHNGNGAATTSVEKGHGRYPHWLWPLYPKAKTDAGCNQCHVADLILDHATTLNRGKEFFRVRGCNGCHRYEGFDTESEALSLNRTSLRHFESDKKDLEKEINQSLKDADAAADNKEAQRLYARADALRQNISNINNEVEQLDVEAKSLLREVKKIGPSLKEVRVKIKKEWIPVWLEGPHTFRPTTRMPDFRLGNEDRQAIAAFIWQSGVQGTLQAYKPGDPARGKELFEIRGCMGCHAVGEGDKALGGKFAANLTRVGEKDNFDYLVRWVHNPRERTRPYCTFEKKDIGPEDYAKKGLPFVFDLDHTLCPNDGHELQVQQMTVMPNLRLTVEEAQDVASYLSTLKKPDAAYPAASYLDDPAMKEKGIKLVRHYGCAGCHEISGLEEEGRIGTELTKEGSKPIERMDFALLTEDAKKKDWYNHDGFIEHKLEKPEIYDEGKIKDPLERLRMPNFRLSPEDLNAVTTFLLGSVDSNLPPHYFYNPKGQEKDIREGWWLINKYNCMGCHQLRTIQKSVLSSLPRYQDPDWKEQLPPTLVGEGARVDPNWLVRFLSNPAQSPTDLNRNGVRAYLKVRMPTFSFSDSEIGKIVRFFVALAGQAQPYLPTRLEPLTDKERSMARDLFTSKAAPCLKCHATGDPAHDRNATAPNFLLAKERLKPGWTQRWITEPAMIAPGTSMPSGLFRHDGTRWVFAGPLPSSFAGYTKDESELLVRYIFQLTSDEQRRLVGSGGSLTKIAQR